MTELTCELNGDMGSEADVFEYERESIYVVVDGGCDECAGGVGEVG